MTIFCSGKKAGLSTASHSRQTKSKRTAAKRVEPFTAVVFLFVLFAVFPYGSDLLTAQHISPLKFLKNIPKTIALYKKTE